MFYALCMAFVLAAIVAVLIDCQWLASFASGAILVLVVFYALMVVIFAAVMKIGSDGWAPADYHAVVEVVKMQACSCAC